MNPIKLLKILGKIKADFEGRGYRTSFLDILYNSIGMYKEALSEALRGNTILYSSHTSPIPLSREEPQLCQCDYMGRCWYCWETEDGHLIWELRSLSTRGNAYGFLPASARYLPTRLSYPAKFYQKLQ